MEFITKIIVKTHYINGTNRREKYVKYIATRDGVEMTTSNHGDKDITPKQKELINSLLKDYPMCINSDEYKEYFESSNRINASNLIAKVMEDNIDTVFQKENYISYIANRPRVEKLGEHGLFSDDDKINLNQVQNEVGENQGRVWTHIISLKREDAARLGYDNADAWRTLCKAKRNEIANAMKIDPNNLKWYAAFHNESHHPHIHMVAYSTNTKEGYVSKVGIDKIRSIFATEIFKNDLLEIYQKQTEARTEVKKYSQDIVIKSLNGLEIDNLDNEYITNKMKDLKDNLKDYRSRLSYAYINQDAKQIINDILREMEKNTDLEKLYKQWLIHKQEINETYNDKLIQKLPLLEQKEFKSIKNMILKEVMNFDKHTQFEEVKMFKEIKEDINTGNVDVALKKLTSEEMKDNEFAQYMLGKLFLFGKEVDQDKDKAIEYLTLSANQGNEYSSQLLEQINDGTYMNQSMELLTSRFFHHVSKIIQNELPTVNNNPLYGIDKKLRRKLFEKKQAMGQKIE